MYRRFTEAESRFAMFLIMAAVLLICLLGWVL